MGIPSLSVHDTRALDTAVEALQLDGAVVVRDAVDTAILRVLKARMDEDTLRLLAYCERIGGNPRERGQLQQGAPTFPPYLHRDLLAHPFVWSVLVRMLGVGAGLMYYNGNTNCPGSAPQNVHLDQAHKSAVVSPVTALVVNIPVQPISAHNGAIEIWLGTHNIVCSQRVPEAMLKARRSVRPPLQVEMQIGDIVIRDARLWHRGVSNPSNEFRHLVGAVYHAAPRNRVVFDHAAAPFVANAGVNLNAAFSDQSEMYLIGPTQYLYEVQARSAVPLSNESVARPLVDI